MEKMTDCAMCDVVSLCHEYISERDADGNIVKEYACKKCAADLKLKTEEEEKLKKSMMSKEGT